MIITLRVQSIRALEENGEMRNWWEVYFVFRESLVNSTTVKNVPSFSTLSDNYKKYMSLQLLRVKVPIKQILQLFLIYYLLVANHSQRRIGKHLGF